MNCVGYEGVVTFREGSVMLSWVWCIESCVDEIVIIILVTNSYR